MLTQSSHLMQGFWLNASDLSQLKPREWKVLILLVDDFTNPDIMKALNLRKSTLLQIRNSIGYKLNLGDIDSLSLFSRSNRDVILYWYTIYRSKLGQ